MMTRLSSVVAYLLRALAPPLALVGAGVCAQQVRTMTRWAPRNDPRQREMALRARADASDRRAVRLEAEVERLRKVADQSERAKDDFLATLSHELRTPLNATLGWIQLLRLQMDQPVQRAYALDVLERNARKQEQIMRDLLDISRIVAGEMALTIARVDLSEVVERAATSVRPAAAARDVRLDIRVESAVHVVGDSIRLGQVTQKLLSNALKFTPDGGRVTVSLWRTDATAVLQVSDTGIGIPADVLPHVFDRFLQADSSLTREFGGLGLGLAIVLHLVELHGGTVDAASAGVERGSTFTVRLPAT